MNRIVHPIVRVIKSIMIWAGHVACMGEKGCIYRILVGKPKGKRWEDNIKMDLREVGRGGMEWIVLDQDRYRWKALVNTVINLRVP